MAMPIYGNHLVIEQIKREFHYIFESNYPGIPQLEIHEIHNQRFEVGNLPVLPIQVLHHKLPVFGFRIHDFTYITDANSIPEAEYAIIYGTKILVINALQKDDHLSHFTLSEALEVVERVKPEKAYFTHISHNLGLHKDIAKELPANVMLAYDGLSLTL
jgi:phosphoribosyl 1,2-cyclic phosphate phosphodiesterase